MYHSLFCYQSDRKLRRDRQYQTQLFQLKKHNTDPYSLVYVAKVLVVARGGN